jgi:type I restriction enzyme S subunit
LLYSTFIPFPADVNEQRRIVARIEELTRRAEEARKLRQEAVDKVKGLFQTELERIFLPIETDDWTEYDAREVFDIVKGQVDPREEPYASMPHVAPDVMEIGTGRLFLDKVKTAKELELKSGKYLFDATHVLYSKIRPNLRKVALPDFKGTCSADMYPLIPNTEVVTREFLALVLLSPPFTAYAVENSDRNAMPKVNRPTMFGYRVRLPEKSVQQEIVSRLRAMQEKAEEITRLQNDVDEDLSRFQPALLAKAFRGEL